MIDLPQSGLDPAAFARLERALTPHDLAGRLRALLESVPHHIEAASKAYARGEIQAIADVASTLCANLEEIGGRRLADMCRRLHAAAAAGDRGGCTAMVTALDGEWDAVRAAIDLRLRKMA
jgi:HPt (histidine-containing phosphotransfer) domain-containing protein